MSTYICIGSIGTVALFGAIAIAIYFMVQLHKRYITWRINGELAELKRLKAKYDVTIEGAVVSDVVFNPVATYYIAQGATKLELIKDTEGKDALQFEAADQDGSHTYALLSNGVMHLRIGGQWRLYGDRLDASNMLMSMKPRKQLSDGGHKQQASKVNKQSKHQDNNDNGDDEYPVLPIKRTKAWFDEDKRWTNKPGNPLPDGYRWRQFKGGQWGIGEDE